MVERGNIRTFVPKIRTRYMNFILADNQEITRYALEALIRQDESNTIRRATDKAGLIELLKEEENSVVVLDYTLFDFADVEQLLIVSERFLMAQWILISDELTPKFLRKVIYSSHQFSVLFKDGTMKDIRDALRAVAANSRFISQVAVEQILAQQQEDEKPDVLTATEMEIVKLIARGRTTKEIASERISSIHTITTHRKNIFRKLGVNTAHEALKYAIKAGWVDPNDFYI